MIASPVVRRRPVTPVTGRALVLALLGAPALILPPVLILSLTLILALLLMPVPAQAGPGPTGWLSPTGSPASASQTSTDAIDAIGSATISLMEELDVPGAAVALVSGGEVVWTSAYRLAAREPVREMEPDTLFRAESISKSVTAWGVLTLIESGTVELDAPVRGYLPAEALPELPDDVTVRHLLTHTSGLPLGTIGHTYPPDESRPSLLDDLRDEVRSERPAGTSFAYSNVGYNLLELMIEHVTGEDFAVFMDRTVLEPLGMTASTFAWPADRADTLATGHRSSGAAVPPYVYPARASGGLHTTAADVARFVAAGGTPQKHSNPVLSEASIDLVHTPYVGGLGIYGAVADGYGFGHFTEVLDDGRVAVWHGGQGTGWMTHFHLVPETGDGIVILTNSQRSWPLISGVVATWASETGLGPVQLGRLAQANGALRVVLGLWALVVVATSVVMTVQLRAGRRRFAPLARETRMRRLVLATVAAVSLVALAWAAGQPYLMVSSLFPSLVPWLGLGVLVTALLALAAAVLPRRADR